MTDAHRTERSASDDLLLRTRSLQGTFALCPACGFSRISLPFRDTQARSQAFRVFLEDPRVAVDCCRRMENSAPCRERLGDIFAGEDQVSPFPDG